LWDAILPAELLVLPVELGRVDVVLDDPVFFAPFARYFDARIGRPSIPVETYLRLMFRIFFTAIGHGLRPEEHWVRQRWYPSTSSAGSSSSVTKVHSFGQRPKSRSSCKTHR
jgi:hypothetical protein